MHYFGVGAIYSELNLIHFSIEMPSICCMCECISYRWTVFVYVCASAKWLMKQIELTFVCGRKVMKTAWTTFQTHSALLLLLLYCLMILIRMNCCCTRKESDGENTQRDCFIHRKINSEWMKWCEVKCSGELHTNTDTQFRV